MTTPIVRKAQTGETGNPGQFGTIERADGPDLEFTNPEGYTHFAGSGVEHDEGDIVDIDGFEWELTGDGWLSVAEPGETREPLGHWQMDAYDRTFVSSRADRNEKVIAGLGGGIVGYTYKAENYTPAAVAYAITGEPADEDEDIEAFLSERAAELGVDRTDEYSYDSDDFPKPIYRGQLGAHDDLEWLGR